MFTQDYSLLIIDDDVTTIKLIAESLKSEFDVSFVTSAARGLEKAEQEPLPDVILLDVMMPEMNGFEVCRLLKQNPVTQHIPVIFVTSLNKQYEQQKGFELGAVDYVTKPIEYHILRARVKTHARLRKQVLQLENLAATDPMTSCANRRRFEELLPQEWKRAARAKAPISIMMLDVDNFKAFNDHYGHGKGDECLVSMSQIIRRSIRRPADMVARIGGEEFAVILPNTDEEGASVIAQKVLDLCRSESLVHEHSDAATYASFSIGIGTFYPEEPLDHSWVLDKVDSALYRAKEAGKNQYKFV